MGMYSQVQFSHSVISDSLWPHGLQHARLSCASPTPRTCSNSCPSSRWCHPIISSSVVPFSPCLQSFPASASFPRSQFFASGGQSIGSFSFGISPSNEHSGLISFRMDWFDLHSPRDSQESSPTPQLKSIKCIVKAMVFLVVMYGCESWTIKKAECQRVDASELWCWRWLLRVPWTERRSTNES